MRAPLPLLTRYIFAEVLKVFCFVLTCLTVLLVFVGVFQQAADRGLGTGALLQIVPYIVPSMLPFTIPATLLLTVSVVYGRVAGDQEVIAAKAAGISPMSFLWPTLFLGALLSVASLVLTDQIIPWAWGRIEAVAISAMEDIFLDRLRSELRVIESRRGEEIEVIVARVEGKSLIHPVFQYRRRDNQVITVQAELAEMEFDLPNRQVILHVKNGYVDIPERGRTQVAGWIELPFPLSISDGDTKARYMTIRQIEAELKKGKVEQRRQEERVLVHDFLALARGDLTRLPEQHASHAQLVYGSEKRFRKLRTEVHGRYAMACSCFFFVLLGGPFSILQAKSQFLTSFFYCFGPIVGAYYPLMLGLMTQAKDGAIDPSWSVWVANILLALAALYFIRKIRRY